MANPAIVVVAAPTSTGNQDITGSLGGATPKAVLFLYARGGTDGAVTNGSGASFGVTDGTNQWACATFIPDGEARAGTAGFERAKTDKCIMAIGGTGVTASLHSEAQVVGMIANGVRINWTTAHVSDAWLVTAVFFYGSDWEAAVGNWTVGSPPTVALGWQPNCVLMGSAHCPFGAATIISEYCLGGNGWDSTGSRGGTLGMIASNPSSPVTIQKAQGWHHASSQGGEKFTTFGFTVDVTRSATGFSVTETGVSTADGWGYLALKWTGNHVRSGCLKIDDATGNQVFSGIQLIPKFMLLFPSHTAVTSAGLTISGGPMATDLNHRAAGIIAINASECAGFTHHSAHGVTPTREHSVALDGSIQMFDEDGSGAIDTAATVVSLDHDGITLNFSTASFPLSAGQVDFWGFLAFGPIVEAATARVFAAILD